MTRTSALKLVPSIASHPLAGRPVLESAPLRRGFKRSALSRFEDSTWDLAPAVFRTDARICHITAYFDGVADPGVERTLREFLYARLNFDVPGHRCRMPPSTLRQVFNRTRRFLEFVAARQGACNLAAVDQALLDAYRDRLKADPQRTATRVSHLLEVVTDLHHYRDHMPSHAPMPSSRRSTFPSSSAATKPAIAPTSIRSSCHRSSASSTRQASIPASGTRQHTAQVQSTGSTAI